MDIEHWYSFDGDLVEVSLKEDGPGRYRVTVSGTDDFGMEKSFTSLMEVKVCFKSLNECAIASLTARGFERA